jgi:hypothetical protein
MFGLAFFLRNFFENLTVCRESEHCVDYVCRKIKESIELRI